MHLLADCPMCATCATAPPPTPVLPTTLLNSKTLAETDRLDDVPRAVVMDAIAPPVVCATLKRNTVFCIMQAPPFQIAPPLMPAVLFAKRTERACILPRTDMPPPLVWAALLQTTPSTSDNAELPSTLMAPPLPFPAVLFCKEQLNRLIVVLKKALMAPPPYIQVTHTEHTCSATHFPGEI